MRRENIHEYVLREINKNGNVMNNVLFFFSKTSIILSQDLKNILKPIQGGTTA